MLEGTSTPSRDHDFREWLPFHVYWFFLEQGVVALRKSIDDSNAHFADAHVQVSIGDFPTLEQYLVDCRKEHFHKAFSEWRPLMKPSAPSNEQPHLDCTIRRVFYR